VDDSATLVAGDVQLSKGEDVEFEVTIEHVKPGVWSLTHDTSSEEDSEIREVIISWTSPGPLDHKNPPALHSIAAKDAKWEDVGSFSVDSGVAGILCKGTIDNVEGEERESLLEGWCDEGLDSQDGNALIVSGGLILSGNDGGYSLQGRRDAEGNVVEVKLVLA